MGFEANRIQGVGGRTYSSEACLVVAALQRWRCRMEDTQNG
jgi:hypothetical protein